MLATLPLLQHLTLHASSGRALSDGFPVSLPISCERLQSLNLRFLKPLELPLELGRLEALTRLVLGDQSVASLPHSISQLRALKELMMTEMTVEDLPPGAPLWRWPDVAAPTEP